ncbi:hypothetical protein THAOC_21372 [Thalassiosira oceanica]|uniref:Uncharacterized protein n=1 Tax=Thalassiosira oceanica TaxID=159749 RepID=K0RZI9_THAOC|nr:hypothetical protein THAOC_21372 [Thalassiosira oceanica]|eukprot:EJK58495.1 hypothetical protein THAOC_21372 [Thalassiosira oceanica]
MSTPTAARSRYLDSKVYSVRTLCKSGATDSATNLMWRKKSTTPAIASRTTPENYASEHEHETRFPQLAAGEIASDQGLRGWGQVGTETRTNQLKSDDGDGLDGSWRSCVSFHYGMEDETDDISPGGTSRQSGRDRTTVCSRRPGRPAALPASPTLRPQYERGPRHRERRRGRERQGRHGAPAHGARRQPRGHPRRPRGGEGGEGDRAAGDEKEHPSNGTRQGGPSATEGGQPPRPRRAGAAAPALAVGELQRRPGPNLLSQDKELETQGTESR